MPQLVVRIALRTLDFEKPFPTDHSKINNLTQTVDQEVGGSNPPSCTNHIVPPVPDLLFVRLAATRGRAFSSTPASTCRRLGDPHSRPCGYGSQGGPAAHNTIALTASHFAPSYSGWETRWEFRWKS